jgi:hypothetical protein
VAEVAVTELTVSDAHGVRTEIVHDALVMLDDAIAACYAQAHARAAKLAGTIITSPRQARAACQGREAEP